VNKILYIKCRNSRRIVRSINLKDKSLEEIIKIKRGILKRIDTNKYYIECNIF
jgi:hypothetical protein